MAVAPSVWRLPRPSSRTAHARASRGSAAPRGARTAGVVGQAGLERGARTSLRHGSFNKRPAPCWARAAGRRTAAIAATAKRAGQTPRRVPPSEGRQSEPSGSLARTRTSRCAERRVGEKGRVAAVATVVATGATCGLLVPRRTDRCMPRPRTLRPPFPPPSSMNNERARARARQSARAPAAPLRGTATGIPRRRSCARRPEFPPTGSPSPFGVAAPLPHSRCASGAGARRADE